MVATVAEEHIIFRVETLVTTYQTPRCHIPEDYNINLHQRKDLKF
jgi:hypothetical protein